MCVNRFRRAGENSAALDVRSHVARGVVGSADDVAQVRREFAWWLQRRFFLDESRRCDLTLAVNEALTNAVEFGYFDGTGEGLVVFDATYDKITRLLTVTVSNRGRWRLRLAETATVDRSLATRGRGIVLMDLLTDELRIVPSERGTEVSLVWNDLQPRFPILFRV